MHSPAQSEEAEAPLALGWRAAWIARDRQWARTLHRAAACRPLLRVLIFASTVGDGAIWAAVATLLWLIGGPFGETCAVAMLLMGAANVLIYLGLKRRTGRPRPYVQCPDIVACTRSLDQFSFPSGHTLHAVAFSLLVGWYFPLTAAVLLPFALVVMLSRVVLGLHYPSDVLAGVVLGLASAATTLVILAGF